MELPVTSGLNVTTAQTGGAAGTAPSTSPATAQSVADHYLEALPLAADAPMRREWVVVCDAPGLSACLTAWELPGQAEVPDRHRIFESLWTVDPRAVRDAARVCAQVAQSAGVAEARGLLYDLADDPGAGVADIAGATALMNRVVAYVDRFGT